jgi:hypothetical protein
VDSTLIGVLITAAVSLIGIGATLVANHRVRQEHRDEQARLKLDAAMRAGALFSAADRPADPASIASGLLALTRLDHADLAVALLVDLWSDPKRSVDEKDQRVATETAVLVIDAALRSTSTPNAQLVAAELLCSNAHRLDSSKSLHWPSVIDGGWDPKFAPRTKLLLIDGLILMTKAGPACDYALRSIAVRLYGVWKADRDRRVRGCVGRVIAAVLPEIEKFKYKDFMQGNQRVLLADLQRAAASATRNPDGYLDHRVAQRCTQLEEWIASRRSQDTAEDRRLVTAAG